MKTSSDILMTEICNYQDQYEIYGFDSYFDNDELAKAKTLAEAERKVLEHILIERGSYFNDPGRTAQEIKRFNKYVNDLKRLREEMGLQ